MAGLAEPHSPPRRCLEQATEQSVDVSLLKLRRILRFGRRPRFQAGVTHAGVLYRRDHEGAWRDSAGVRADPSTCFALVERGRALASRQVRRNSTRDESP